MRSLLLTALLTALPLASCASDPVPPEQLIREQAAAMRSAIAKVVAEPARRAELLAQVDALELVLQEQNRDLNQLSVELQSLNADYDAPRARFEEALAHFRERVDARYVRVQAAHFEMVRRTDAKEWKRLVDLEHAALKAAGTADVQALTGGKS
ncbi:MAG: hypothetical protein HZA53_15675 [Planctomycetes bacterium]|nr:hypothetical protein [Planctomycetota bacterium]